MITNFRSLEIAEKYRRSLESPEGLIEPGVHSVRMIVPVDEIVASGLTILRNIDKRQPPVQISHLLRVAESWATIGGLRSDAAQQK